MSNPNLHVKDSYYFEVPHSWRSPEYTSLDQVPDFLVKANPHASLEEFEHAMAGKILIPQVFGGELKNFYEAEQGFCISKFMVLEFIVAAVLIVAFVFLANAIRGGKSAGGRIYNMLEVFVEHVRNDVVRPVMGREDENTFLPYLLTVFFFIWFSNLLGMIPFMGTITGDLHITGTLALMTFGYGVVYGIKKLGYVGFFGNMMPHIDMNPAIAYPLQIMIFAIELLGYFIKHAVLALRLFANMVAGHLVLLGISMVLVELAKTSGFEIWAFGAAVGVFGSALFSLLELLVAFLQAYVFLILSTVFIGMSVHHH